MIKIILYTPGDAFEFKSSSLGVLLYKERVNTM